MREPDEQDGMSARFGMIEASAWASAPIKLPGPYGLDADLESALEIAEDIMAAVEWCRARSAEVR